MKLRLNTHFTLNLPWITCLWLLTLLCDSATTFPRLERLLVSRRSGCRGEDTEGYIFGVVMGLSITKTLLSIKKLGFYTTESPTSMALNMVLKYESLAG